MKSSILKTALLLIAICYLPIAGFAQGGSCSPDKIALKDTGRPAGGALIKVCPAGGTFPGCASSLFTDPTLSVGATNPVTADSLGNWGFCATAGVNYDYQITCSGCTTLTVHNFPLPPSSPIVANALTSSSANPANVGLIKLASGDCLDWRNNANSGNIQLCKDTSDNMDASAFPAVLALNVKQGNATTSFAVLDNAGVAHFFVSGTSPYTNTFISGNGSGNVFLGSAAKTSVSDTTGNITVSGSTSGTTGLKASAVASGTLTFPAATDTLVGKATTDTLTNKTLTSPAITTPAINGITINGVPSVMQFSCTGTATAASTLSLSGGACTNTLGILFPVSSSATIANLRCKSQGAGVNASSGAVTVRKNGVAQTTTCTIGTGTTCSDLTHTFSVAAGDTVDLVFTTQTAETLGNIGCTVEKQ